MDIGATIRLQRMAKGISIRELARLTGLSPSAISQIETGKSVPNILTMKAIAEALGISVISFLMENLDTKISLVKPEERPRLIRNSTPTGDLIEEFLTRGRNFQMEPAVITVPPEADSGRAISHPGEELIFILEGELKYILEGVNDYNLKKGDCLYYPCTIPHRWRNPSRQIEAQFLIVATPSLF
ncbi:HTH-type transcriptional regulator PuuR [Neomoorella glycerini]|uniref:HTH-type transcriptional regulator PuuR n=1 Tax=Neomoorella glycerini TaxID=55779 RepID=A0A6I5ZRK1_9FIRM|nr:cupin domain-containing protein [Moorella glycerini]QGP92624.1 HTH-type transcriptional regulator PuuR [Moorella glycerini]